MISGRGISPLLYRDSLNSHFVVGQRILGLGLRTWNRRQVERQGLSLRRPRPTGKTGTPSVLNLLALKDEQLEKTQMYGDSGFPCGTKSRANGFRVKSTTLAGNSYIVPQEVACGIKHQRRKGRSVEVYELRSPVRRIGYFATACQSIGRRSLGRAAKTMAMEISRKLCMVGDKRRWRSGQTKDQLGVVRPYRELCSCDSLHLPRFDETTM